MFLLRSVRQLGSSYKLYNDGRHYVLGSLTYPGMCKTGSTRKRMDERLKKINSKQDRDLGLFVVLVYNHGWPLEQRVRSKLDARGCRQPSAEYGVNGIEFRLVSVDTVQAAIAEVKKECETEAPERGAASSAGDSGSRRVGGAVCCVQRSASSWTKKSSNSSRRSSVSTWSCRRVHCSCRRGHWSCNRSFSAECRSCRKEL